MQSNYFLNFFTVLKDANIRQLLNDKGFAVLKGQLIFEREGEIYVTNIEETKSDYTTEDYTALPEGAPFELINGKLIFMPSPTSLHQQISMNLSSLLHVFARKNKLGRVLTAPMDVYLDKKNVFQPDILFVSKKREDIIGKFIQGAPELIVEIASPSTKAKDESEKLAAYSKFGVQEYWLINPKAQEVTVYFKNGKKMKKKETLKKNQVLKTMTIKGFIVDVADIFEE